MLVSYVSPNVMPEGPCLGSNLMINEIEQNPQGADSGNEWVELLNPSSEYVNVLGWQIQTSAGERKTYPLSESVVPPGGFFVVVFPFQFLDNVDESVRLLDRKSREVDATPTLTDNANDGRSWQRIPDGLQSASAWKFTAGTKGLSNSSVNAERSISMFCSFLARITLAFSAAVIAFLAWLPTGHLLAGKWPRSDIFSAKENLATRLWIFLFGLLIGVLVFHNWLNLRLTELAWLDSQLLDLIAVLMFSLGAPYLAGFIERVKSGTTHSA